MSVARVVVFSCLFPAVFCWINTNVERKIDISNAIVRATISATVQNDGTTASDELEWVIPASNMTRFTKNSMKVAKVEVSLTCNEQKGENFWCKVKLNKAVEPGASVTIKHRVCSGGVLRPLPPTVKQSESQLVDYLDNVYFLSPYPTKRQTTTVKLATPSVEKYTKVPAPVTHTNDNVVFGEYKDVTPMSSAPLRVHSVNNKPFVTARTLKRVIEVSMWGNLAVEEWYDIENIGAKLKGTFSRLDYQKPGARAPSSFTDLRASLPADADDIYFRDDIGNISTSRVFPADSLTKDVIFTQRFPLFGGWKTRFYFGYNLPLDNVLTHNGAVNRLKVPYASPVRDLWIQDMTVEVVLPEGVPRPIVRVGGKVTENFEIVHRSTYLDYSGRTVVVMHDQMLSTPERNEDIEIEFVFSSTSLLWEPMYLISAFMVLFSSIIFFGRVVS
ncbi:Dolichyl-diphosphooligosaccharide--protein glycosyltransferase subunit 1A [Diplonema papillatum]|nr:Dolichyl-diphosphooligosaccharide--protein glycosyltransferase subunit 1A [Diplonema papillatum]